MQLRSSAFGIEGLCLAEADYELLVGGRTPTTVVLLLTFDSTGYFKSGSSPVRIMPPHFGPLTVLAGYQSVDSLSSLTNLKPLSGLKPRNWPAYSP